MVIMAIASKIRVKRTVTPLNISLQFPKYHSCNTPEKYSTDRRGQSRKTKVELPKFEKHVLCDEGGLFPFVYDSSWELEIIIAEIGVSNSVSWYRNPKSPKPESLGIAYDYDGEGKIMRPDFPFSRSDLVER